MKKKLNKNCNYFYSNGNKYFKNTVASESELKLYINVLRLAVYMLYVERNKHNIYPLY